MRKVEIITAEQAAQLVKDNDTITSIGFVSSAHPEALTKALEKRFLDTNTPQNLTYIYAGSALLPLFSFQGTILNSWCF